MRMTPPGARSLVNSPPKWGRPEVQLGQMALISPKGDSLPSSRESSQENRVFSIRIVNLDYYMAAPLPDVDVGYSSFQGRSIVEVPIIRIFGSTTAGQKTCLHLHKVFPYLYVPYDEDLPQEVNEAFVYVRRLSMAIEQAMKMSSSAGGKKQHVHSCSLVRGKKFYGFYPNEQLFIKIVLYHPKEMSRISTLLLAGGIMNRKFQPHESHIQYLLQFLIDHNLSGMGHIHLAKVKFRQPLPGQPLNRAQLLKQLKESFMPKPENLEPRDEDKQTAVLELENRTAAKALPGPSGNPAASSSSPNEPYRWLRGNIPGESMWSNLVSRDAISRHSTCELEVDSSAEDILNKRELLFVPLQSSGPDVKMVQSLTSIWEEELERTGNEGAAGALAHSTPRERMLPPISAHEQALRDALTDIVRQYKPRDSLSPGTDGNVLSSSPVSAEEQPLLVDIVSGDAINRKAHLGVEDVNLQHDMVSPTSVANMYPQSQGHIALSGLENDRLWPNAKASLSLQATQAANAQRAAGTPEEDGEMQHPQVQLDEKGLVNEDIVRNQFTQTSELQGTEKEVIDLLCWMGAAQDDVDVEAYNTVDGNGCEKLDLSQIVCSSEIQAALTKALSDYEGASNAECQEILECSGGTDDREQREVGSSEEEEANVKFDDGVGEHVNQDFNIAGVVENEIEPQAKRQRSNIQKGMSKGSYCGPSIPQIDGQYDEQEDTTGEDEPQCHLDPLLTRGQMEETLSLSTAGGESPASTPPQKTSRAASVEKSSKWKAPGRPQGPKYPVSKPVMKSHSSWCALPLIGTAPKPTASLHEIDQETDQEANYSGKKRLLDHHGLARVEVVAEQTSLVKAKEVCSLRDLMRRRRVSKRLKRHMLSKHPTTIPDREAYLEDSRSDHQSDASDVEENIKMTNHEKKGEIFVKRRAGQDRRGDNRDCGGGERSSRGSAVLHDRLPDNNTPGGDVTLQPGPDGIRSSTLSETPVLTACQNGQETLPEMIEADLGVQPVCFAGPGITFVNGTEALGSEPGLQKGYYVEKKDHAMTGGEARCAGHDAIKNVKEEATSTEQKLYTRVQVQANSRFDGPKVKGCGKEVVESFKMEVVRDPNCGTWNAAASTAVVLPANSKAAISTGDGTDSALCDASAASSVRHSNAGSPDTRRYSVGWSSGLIVKQDTPGKLEGEGHDCIALEATETDRCELFHLAFSGCNALRLNEFFADVEDNTSMEQQVYQVSPDERLFPLSLIRKPPTRAHCLDTLSDYGLKSKDHGKAFFGNIKDVPPQQTVMAGLVFDLKSNEGGHLPPFLFGVPGKLSRSDKETKQRKYVENELWGLPLKGDFSMGAPVHFENDESIFYLLTPARSPPSQANVRQWLQEKKLKDSNGTHKFTKDIFTMDANTGSLVAFTDADGVDTQDTQSLTQGSFEDNGYFRPASPKYDEKHVLALTIPSGHPAPSDEEFHNASVAPVARTVTSDVDVHSHVSEIHQSPVPEAQPKAEEKMELVGETQLKKHHVSFQVSAEAVATVKDTARPTRQWRDVSQITGPSVTTAHITPLSQCGFRDPASLGGGQQVTLASIEVHEDTRGDLRPDPRYDSIGCIVVVFQDDYMPFEESISTFVLVRDENAWRANKNLDGVTGCEVVYLPNEVELLNFFIRLVKLYDPDILLGWEIQGFSLGLLAERAANLGIGLLKQLSRTHVIDEEGLNAQQAAQGNSERVLFETTGGHETVIDDEWGRTQGSGIYVGGRTVLNLWRIMRGEVKLGIYSVEAVAEMVLRRRVPRIPWRTLTDWFRSGPERERFRCLEYFIDRASLNLQILNQLDLLSRTAELARIFGIEFFSVFSRGSQYRVESMLLRIAHTQNFLMISPSKQQVGAQPAMECLPLVMEPESRFYTSPVVVLDFQSLYPSMIIAYNLCFSTCLGKIVSQNPKVLGVTSLHIQHGLLSKLKDKLTLTPNGVMYAPPEVCRGVLPRLLDEILNTRIMVKKAMKKLGPKEKVRQRVLNARQFALKLIANVTYGYTAAGFSGRMPCAELADSIVQCGRITLERAIHQVNSHPQWGARVVYGDTDSMFVLLEGRTREEAFKIGQEIASAVTATNPPPVVLKMEKVYHPCVLLTKKRYVGYSYESPGQTKPTFDAKGIETVRRDSCPAVGKTMERSLRILFESKDLSKVKRYLQRQWGKILSGRISVRDFVFAKEVRLGTYSAKASVLPPAAIVASKAMTVDPRAEPRYGERIPYVVIHGEPGARLVDMVVDPNVLLNNPLTLRLHDTYYITKQIIPSLQRIFGLVGVDLKLWYHEMPRVYQAPSKKPASSAILPPGPGLGKGGLDVVKLQQRAVSKATIDNYYLSRHCAVCGAFTRGSGVVCTSCSKDARLVAIVTTGRASQLEKELKHLEAICRHCGGDDGSPERKIICLSLDCPVFFERRKADKELQSASATTSRCNQSTLDAELF